MKQEALIKRIEKRAGGVAAAYRLLKISKSRWHAYKTGTDLPDSNRQSIVAHLALTDDGFEKIQSA